MSENLINTVREALEAATPGPWEVNSADCGNELEDYTVYGVKGVCAATVTYDDSPAFAHTEGMSEADAHLIANAPQWLAELCAEVDRQRTVIEMANGALGGMRPLLGELGRTRARLEAAEKACELVIVFQNTQYLDVPTSVVTYQKLQEALTEWETLK